MVTNYKFYVHNIETEYETPDGNCPSEAHGYECTREAGHPMPHSAGLGLHTSTATWED